MPPAKPLTRGCPPLTSRRSLDAGVASLERQARGGISKEEATPWKWILHRRLLLPAALSVTRGSRTLGRGLKHFIHGVDKNQMAVELAMASVWLHTFAVGVQFSFLDRHLRCGDSPFGAWVQPPSRGSRNRSPPARHIRKASGRLEFHAWQHGSGRNGLQHSGSHRSSDRHDRCLH